MWELLFSLFLTKSVTFSSFRSRSFVLSCSYFAVISQLHSKRPFAPDIAAWIIGVHHKLHPFCGERERESMCWKDHKIPVHASRQKLLQSRSCRFFTACTSHERCINVSGHKISLLVATLLHKTTHDALVHLLQFRQFKPWGGRTLLWALLIRTLNIQQPQPHFVHTLYLFSHAISPVTQIKILSHCCNRKAQATNPGVHR